MQHHLRDKAYVWGMEELVSVSRELAEARTREAVQTIAWRAALRLTGVVTFTPDKIGISLFQGLVASVEAALNNAQLHEEMAARVREKTAALEAAQRAEKALIRVQEQLRQSQKLEAIGLLAAGVAHDFNNVLTVILSYGILIQSRVEDPQLKEDVAEIILAGERASALTKQLLAFSKQQVLDPQVLDVGHVLDGTGKLLQKLLPHDIELEVSNDPDLHTVFADPHQVEQVLLNLTVNARDAMPISGTLRIQTRNIALTEHAVPGAAAGDYVLLTVSDTGVGMSEDIKERIFEPFFTTKEMGTGLGLSTVYGIVRQSGGHITVDSKVNQGSTFSVYLPRHDGVEPIPVEYTQGRVPGGVETILVVEVESRVRQVTCRILRRAGYTVVEALGATEALEVLDSPDRGEVTLVVTDCALPGQTGLELAQHYQAQYPGVRVLWMAGSPPEGLEEAGFPFLIKPLTPTTLLMKVRAVLDAPTYGASVGKPNEVPSPLPASADDS